MATATVASKVKRKKKKIERVVVVIDLMTHCQVVSRPFAQDLAEPVEALAPDGGDEVKGGGVGARLFPVCAARQRDEAAAVPAV